MKHFDHYLLIDLDIWVESTIVSTWKNVDISKKILVYAKNTRTCSKTNK